MGDDTPYHHGSHRDLLASPPVDSWADRHSIDAIFVPTARPPAHLSGAATLAKSLGCILVTLHSKKWTTAAEARKRLPADLNLIAVDVRDTARLNLPDWRTTDELADSVFACRSDLSTKRNLALALSRMLGWSRILFLDDDITGLKPDDVRAAANLLDTYNAVGLHVGGFPDHSVVCHAYQMAGGRQQEFVGGGALAIEVNRSKSFFPSIYNDDWFFLLDGNDSLQSTAVTGEVIQQPYDPFRTPDRARNEELGDVLAEGIYWRLDQNQQIVEADVCYWAGFLVKRRRFIEDVLGMVKEDSDLEPDEKSRRIAALKGSLGRLMLITPELCQSYLKAWAHDRRQWESHINRLPTGLRIPEALARLTQDGSSPLRYKLSDEMHWTITHARLQARGQTMSQVRSHQVAAAAAIPATEPADEVPAGVG